MTLIDGLVVARSGFHHSVNYRSVVVMGDAVLVTDQEEKLAALDATVDHVLPGRSAEVRRPTARELEATVVARLSLEESSAKTTHRSTGRRAVRHRWPRLGRRRPAADGPGVRLPSPDLTDGIPIPESVLRLRRGVTGE